MDTVKFQEVTKSIIDLKDLPPLAPKPRLRRYTGRAEDMPYKLLGTINEEDEVPPKNIQTKHLRSSLVYYTSRLSQAYMDALSVKRVATITPETDCEGIESMNRLGASINNMFSKNIEELDIVIDEIKRQPCNLRPKGKPQAPRSSCQHVRMQRRMPRQSPAIRCHVQGCHRAPGCRGHGSLYQDSQRIQIKIANKE